MLQKNIWIVTLFPEFFQSWISSGVISKANLQFNLQFIQLRDFSLNKYKSVDDSPYGGGQGMVIRSDVLKRVFEEKILPAENGLKPIVIYPNPRGKKWDNMEAKLLATNLSQDILQKSYVFICGRYEGIDQRFIEKYVDIEYSLGDFVLAGGELAVMAILESSFRFIEGVLGNPMSPKEDSFEDNLLDAPQYTRPYSFEGLEVPEILLSGHHQKIEAYKKTKRIEETIKYRPDLLKE